MSEARSSQQADVGAPELGSALARLQQLRSCFESRPAISKLANLSIFDVLRSGRPQAMHAAIGIVVLLVMVFGSLADNRRRARPGHEGPSRTKC